MSRLNTTFAGDETSISPRKRKPISQDLEVDVDAPEPPSRKAARKAKRAKFEPKLSTKPGEERSGDYYGAKDSESSGRSLHGIWIGNLSFSTTKQELQTFISSDGEYPVAEVEITRIHLPLSTTGDRSRPQNKGFAYVDFSTHQAQQNALQLSEKLLAGRRVLIKSSRDFEGRPEKSRCNGTDNETAPSKRVFVGNLDFDMTKEDLENHFKGCGPITSIQIATFEDTGKCKGYAWIDFEDISSAAAAVRGWAESVTANEATKQIRAPKRRLWVNEIRGRKIRAEFAEDKTTRYNKRFGKHARGVADVGGGKEAPDSVQTSGGTQSLRPDRSRPSTIGTVGKLGRSSRYDKQTLTKLTGAIVDAQGKKTIFE
jgi:RNA recognition motif-containing protein